MGTLHTVLHSAGFAACPALRHAVSAARVEFSRKSAFQSFTTCLSPHCDAQRCAIIDSEGASDVCKPRCGPRHHKSNRNRVLV